MILLKSCLIHIITPIVSVSGISYITNCFCNWYGCNTILNIFFRGDIVCNACTDINYHSKNLQHSLYSSFGSILALQISNMISNSKTLVKTD